ncbi:hypothetical protein CKO09_04760 [Chromatium weissei]|nr:hypothetical protein [Chromatium weissei]
MLFFTASAAEVRNVPVTGTPRKEPIKQVVIHATGGASCDSNRRFQSGTFNGIVAHFLRNKNRISIHYIIDRNGDLIRMVPESQVAYHVRGHNMNSIGIELINNGDGLDPFPEPQLATLITLLREILSRYQLTTSHLKSHAELDNAYLHCGKLKIKRKSDPGAAFPWQRLIRELTPNRANLIVVTHNAKINALQKLLHQWTERETHLRIRLKAVLSDQRDAKTALNWSWKQPYKAQTTALEQEQYDLRMASIQETIDQLKRRETELRLELQGFIQAKQNAKAMLRQLRAKLNATL